MGDPSRSGHSGQTEPMVSVVITTYHSAEWILQALESVLLQRTTFPVEIVIADDCSGDKTVALVQGVADRYPGLFRILTRDRNAGTQRNYYDGFEAARGRYIAWLDADDYWTDPLKLQTQVEALEARPDVPMCCHYVRWVKRGSAAEVQRERYPALAPGLHGLESILRSNFVPSPSILFRNGLHRQLPEWYFGLTPITDWPLHVLAARDGGILLLDRNMADYTLNGSSAFWGAGAGAWYRNDIRFYDRIETLLPAGCIRLVRQEKGKRYESLSYLLRKRGEYVASRHAAMGAFRSPALTDCVGSKCKTLLAAVVREVQWRVAGSRPGKPDARA